MSAITKSGNPALSSNIFEKAAIENTGESMTIQGTMNKTFIMLLLALVTGSFTWTQFFSGANVTLYLYGGLFGGLVVALITVFSPKNSPYTAPLYAALEGLFLGAISAMYGAAYDGIVMQAVLLTVGVFLMMLYLYRSGTIQVTDRLRTGIVAATGGIFLLYLLTWILSFFGLAVPLIHQNGLIGIGFSLIVVGVAAFNLLLDFDFIKKASDEGAPKYMEWYGAFGLMVTLVWLYIEMLRLLSKLQSRN
jgi:uncharacterized YccA/Bax inhibitor family protein